ncbi:ribonuclease P protein component [Hydromonas duriensis]|uniref:Ribonuclease P protein component n=1 Tax=Hydromonas duriensis TaxID=1527608 RepID=A0A4R6YAD1_9BURK|nr:ribonuclease P protein component [Hydromonas duriensis]TDR32517.1 ribonuclease P protein component [Hydromonas duriensis]
MVRPNLGLPRTRKILKADAYASALRMKTCAQTECFALHFCAHSPQTSGTKTTSVTEPWSKIGIVVPKKLAKHAIRRNTVKRLTREYFRLHAADLSDGLWVVRLKSKVNHLPLSSALKREWAAQLFDLFAQGMVFATQLKTRKGSRDEGTSL